MYSNIVYTVGSYGKIPDSWVDYLVLNCRAFFSNGRLFRKFGLFGFSYFDGEKELGLSSFRRITLFLASIQEKLETKNKLISFKLS